MIIVYGDVHVTPREALGLVPYKHFGVELPGGGVCENSPRGVRVVPFAEFARSGRSWVQNPDAGPAERAEAVRRAASRIGERRYSLSGNNCEHFANWCATGVAISYQVLAFLTALLQVARAAVAAGLMAAAATVVFAE